MKLKLPLLQKLFQEIEKMDLLGGKMLTLKGGEEVSADVVLKKKTLILFYFTVSNSEACRAFDPKLIEIYQESVIRKLELGVVVVPSDAEKDLYKTNIKNVYYEWFAIRFDDDLIRILPYTYGVTHVPTLIVVRKNGVLVTRNGVPDVEQYGINVLVTWTE